jgi:MFS transporter, ACS family, hexuronate transporter
MRAAELSVPGPPGTAASAGYQALLVGLLSLNFGILFFDRNALNFLMPWVQPDLGLDNTQVGLTASALSLTWALSGLFFGAMSDRTGRRKVYLLVGTVAFCLCSFATGLATTFLLLVGARLLMGASEGMVMPVSQSLIVESVSPRRRGIAMGVAQNFGSNLLGSFAAPVLLVAFATAFGWRNAFFLAGVPGLITAGLLWWLIREEKPDIGKTPSGQKSTRGAYAEILRSRNMILCAIISVLLVSYLVICWAFLPLYLTQVRQFSPQTMGWLMGTLGISATITSFVVPGLSDWIGRKRVMILVPLLGIILPLAAIYFSGSVWILAMIFFAGWALVGCFPMFMATIPSESVNPRNVATAMGFVMGTGEILGGVFLPTIAGRAADLTDLSAPLWIMFGLCSLASLVALGLTETAPAKMEAAARAGIDKSTAENGMVKDVW